MKILAIDTAASLCAACVFDSGAGRELGREVVDLGRGHAERLIGVIDAALRAAGIGYADLDALAVDIGPGSFTGVRVGVSAARGFALALSIPAIGVGALEALAAEAAADHPGEPVFAAIDARRGEAYVQPFGENGEPAAPPRVVGIDEARALAGEHAGVLAGSAALLIAQGSDRTWRIASTAATADIAVTARLAAARDGGAERPKPLYLRAPDAKPQDGAALPRRPA